MADGIRCELNRPGLKKPKSLLAILALPPRERIRYVNSIDSEIIKESRQNICRQCTSSGSAMEPRKNGKLKLLRKMGKALIAKKTGKYSRNIIWKNVRKAKIAFRHQYGVTETYHAKQQDKKLKSHECNDKPATRTITKQLKAEGYKHPVKGKRGKILLRRVSVKWIMQNMTNAQAALLIHILMGGPSPRPRTWKIELPERPFLGVTPDKVDQFTTYLAQQTIS
ncbi:hypothetical protein [Maridesulfovibrio sp.]|uniref:hypothetical protein n=1 Tax=Maridesulfovibrio sp. TaxID=2795000 RepID=UPI0029CA51ED|nr:hypothetical protein [Maridesulfovibrio sp.]